MVVAGSDRTISPDLERWYAKRAKSHTVEVAGASHAVYVSHPKEVADVIEGAARAVSKQLGLRKESPQPEGPSETSRNSVVTKRRIFRLDHPHQIVLETCKSDNNLIVVDTLNVWHESLPEFDYEAIGAKYKAVKHETMTEAESNVWERIQLLIRRFQNADRIVLGTPMWNFGLPYKLKQLIDLVAQRNYLFTYDGKQYGPLLHVEKAIPWRVLLYRPRASITKQLIWIFGCGL
jgi:hypothetical protein